MPEQVIFGPEFLVAIPDSLLTSIVFPDFSKTMTLAFWESVIAITLIGSLESLLSAAAVDKLDPERRQSDLNRDLSAIGIGNLIAGLIGGLPMIAEIVRSSANVDAGARSGWANFFHGLFLLLFVIALPQVIDAIPLASLAALLVYTGFRLTSPQAFANMLDVGKEQLGLFVVTIVSILATNLLAGVVIGILAKLLIHLARGVPLRNILTLSYRVKQLDTDTYLIRVRGSAIFSNILALKSQLAELPDGKSVLFDLSEVFLIDHTVMEFIDHYRDDYVEHGGHCEIRGLEEHEAFSEHELAARVSKPLD
jgi:MFS superfamily sulfate permease-like transporter